MIDEPRRCICGHARDDHYALRVDRQIPDSGGLIWFDVVFTACQHGHGMLYLTNPPMPSDLACSCREYDPEPFPLLADLLGPANLRAAEHSVGIPRPAFIRRRSLSQAGATLAA
jgi:hypothetical protein